MSGARSLWIGAVTALAVGVSAFAASGAGGEGKYSGKVVAVDRAAGTIVVEGMGPWRVKEGVTQVERRTFAVAPSAAFVGLKRASGIAPSGWMGDFVESTLPEWQVQPGSWVIVTLAPDGGRPTAVKIDIWEPGEP